MQSSLDKLSGLEVTGLQSPLCNPEPAASTEAQTTVGTDGRSGRRRDEQSNDEGLLKKKKKRTEECLIRKVVTSLPCRVNYLMSFNAVLFMSIQCRTSFALLGGQTTALYLNEVASSFSSALFLRSVHANLHQLRLDGDGGVVGAEMQLITPLLHQRGLGPSSNLRDSHQQHCTTAVNECAPEPAAAPRDS